MNDQPDKALEPSNPNKGGTPPAKFAARGIMMAFLALAAMVALAHLAVRVTPSITRSIDQIAAQADFGGNLDNQLWTFYR
jgi:hypothetical protein